MARIVVAALPFAGHMRPLTGVAGALVDRGHAVTFYTGAAYRAPVEAVGCTWAPWRHARDFDELALSRTYPQVTDDDGPSGMLSSIRDVVIGSASAQWRDLGELGPYDAIVADHFCLGAWLRSATDGVPWATVELSPLTLPSRYLPPAGMPLPPATGPLGRARDAVLRGLVDATAYAAAARALSRQRVAVGLSSTVPDGIRGTWSPQLLMACGVPELDYPRPDAPPTLHFVGDLAAGVPSRRPVTTDPLADLADLGNDGRPVVHVTQGTVDIVDKTLLRTTVEALADRPVRVVATPVPDRPLPPNAVAADFVPHDSLMPRCSAMVTNGGFGAVLTALRYGVPLLVVPGGRDKPEVARRVAHSGAGIVLGRRRGAADIDRAVGTLLTDSRYAEAARRLAASFAAAGGRSRAAQLVEEHLL